MDLDTECRKLTLRALGRSVSGWTSTSALAEVGVAVRDSLAWVADRGAWPVNPPRWLPTRGQRAARRASDTVHRLGPKSCTRFAPTPTVTPR